ncbi:aminoglycoside phosphotransferase [Nocardiopsis metallicus]|uniref:Aminoglycoside phosphotransferase n=1 Tax=Nocardiopsis metallicus TaxID=179819 RepID=A0A840WFG2_9ACTN|nr:aminoglycoside phosphotransferase [Nocardiopsis metallicus]
MATGTQTLYVKLSPDPADHTRERAGLAFAAQALDPLQAPRVLAADESLLALATSPVPGSIVRGLELTVGEEQRVHARAGALLRRWHERSPRATSGDHASICTSITRQAGEADQILPLIAKATTAAQQALVRDAALELPRCAPATPVVYRHGDYATRNWLWDPHHGFGIIDFAKAAPGLLVEELVWLQGARWLERPDLRRAFFDGYGRELSQAEERALQLLTVRLAASYLATGLTQGDSALVERGHQGLERLERAHT